MTASLSGLGVHLLQATNNISPLATLVSYYDPPGIACDVYGGAIIVNANRTDLNVVQDLKDQVVSEQMQRPACTLLACPGTSAAVLACLQRDARACRPSTSPCI